MKAKTISTGPCKFKPVTIEITFESLDELHQLYHIFNEAGRPEFKTCVEGLQSKPSRVPFYKEDHTYPIWKLLADILEVEF